MQKLLIYEAPDPKSIVSVEEVGNRFQTSVTDVFGKAERAVGQVWECFLHEIGHPLISNTGILKR